MSEIKTAWQDELQAAYDGSWYWIGGCGGDLQQWIDGYEEAMKAQDIGTPVQWYRATGAEINNFMGVQYGSRHAFPTDLTCLMFPLDGLNVGKLAMFKIGMGDRWFDDLVQNTRRHVAREARA